MHIAICGRMFHKQEMLELAAELEKLGYGVTVPQGARINPPSDDLKRDEFKYYFGEIAGSDLILVLNLYHEGRNIDGYIGGNTFLEMGFAYVMNKPIVVINRYGENSECYTHEIDFMNPIVLSNLAHLSNLDVVLRNHLARIESAAACMSLLQRERELSTNDPFRDTDIRSLDPHYDFRKKDIAKLLNELAEEEVLLNSLPTHRVREGKQRLRKLKWAILADSQSIQISRRVYESEQFIDDDIKMLLKLCTEREAREDEHETSPVMCPVPQTSGPSSATCVTVDNYGLYVPSLAEWINRVQAQITDPEVLLRTSQLLDHLVRNPREDGPAVIVSPGKLHELYDQLRCNAGDELKALRSAPEDGELLLLKLTLLHEIGHHVYPVPAARGLHYLSEAMANWFAYCCLNYDERHVLHVKTLTQSSAYRMYQGIVALRDPLLLVVKHRISAMMPKPSMGGILTLIEQAAFDDPSKPAPDWSAMLNHDDLDTIHNGWSQYSVNPAHILGLIILREATSMGRYTNLIAQLNDATRWGLKLTPDSVQNAWHQYMWKINQVIKRAD